MIILFIGAWLVPTGILRDAPILTTCLTLIPRSLLICVSDVRGIVNYPAGPLVRYDYTLSSHCTTSYLLTIVLYPSKVLFFRKNLEITLCTPAVTRIPERVLWKSLGACPCKRM